MPGHVVDLERVNRKAKDVAKAKDALAATIRAAHEQGHTLRAIAVAAHLSHEQVRRMIRSDQS